MPVERAEEILRKSWIDQFNVIGPHEIAAADRRAASLGPSAHLREYTYWGLDNATNGLWVVAANPTPTYGEFRCYPLGRVDKIHEAGDNNIIKFTVGRSGNKTWTVEAPACRFHPAVAKDKNQESDNRLLCDAGGGIVYTKLADLDGLFAKHSDLVQLTPPSFNDIAKPFTVVIPPTDRDKLQKLDMKVRGARKGFLFPARSSVAVANSTWLRASPGLVCSPAPNL